MAKDIKISISDEEIKVYVNGVEVFTSDESDEHEDETTTYNFDDAVNFICRGSGKDFLNVVRYAISHNNKFPRFIKELSGAVNADDVYCSVLIRLTRHLGETIENKVFVLFKAALDCHQMDGNFIEVFEALKIINNL